MPYIVLRPDSVYVPGPGDLGFSHCVVRVSSSTTVLFAYKWVRERARLFCKQTAVALTLGEGGATPCLYFPNSVFIQKPRRCPFREDFATAASLRSFIIYFFFGTPLPEPLFIFSFCRSWHFSVPLVPLRGTWARGNICHFARSPTAGAKVQPRALSGAREMWWPV